MNLKGSANQKNEWSSPPKWQCHTAHQSVNKGGNCNNGDAILRIITSWNIQCDKLQCFSKEFYTNVLRTGGKIVPTMEETLWENILNFEKYAPMIYANFITLVMILSEKKKQ
jgi:hypothetical protein